MSYQPNFSDQGRITVRQNYHYKLGVPAMYKSFSGAFDYNRNDPTSEEILSYSRQ